MKRHNIDAVLQSVPTLIYDAAHRVGWHRRVAREIATTLFWAAWIYFMLPLLTVLAWYAGLQLAYLEIFAAPVVDNFVYTLPRYVLVVLVIAFVFLNWVGLQLWSRRGFERRLPPPPCALQEVAERFGVPLDALRASREERIVVAHHAESGGITRLVAHQPRSATRPANA